MVAYIAGNGESRRRICVRKVKEKGYLYGCNALYKEITPDVLVATDYDQAHTIQMTGYAKHNRFYTREPYANTGAKKLKMPYANWCSGANAIQLAIEDGHKELYIFGFDFGSNNGKFNNVYAGHEHYRKKNDEPIDGKNWFWQISILIKFNKTVKFNFVFGEESVQEYIDLLQNFENVKILSIRDFLIHINNNV